MLLKYLATISIRVKYITFNENVRHYLKNNIIEDITYILDIKRYGIPVQSITNRK